jgi:hypothetical protein
VHEPERIDKLVYLDAAYDRVRAVPRKANGADEHHAPPDPTDLFIHLHCAVSRSEGRWR